jgi:hypothetical protein
LRARAGGYTAVTLDESVDLTRIRDLEGRTWHPWVRRVVLGLLVVLVGFAAAGAFGQRTEATTAGGNGANMRLEAPGVLRGGLLWRARLVIRASRRIDDPRVVLGPGFAKGMQLNTIEPSPASEAGRGSRIVLSYPALDPGDELVVYLQLQANPTTVGDQDTSIELDDATVPLVRIAHTTTVLP